jgi:hypothetical protein
MFLEKSNPHLYPGLPPWGLNIDRCIKHDLGDANKQIVYMFIVKIMKCPIYMSLSYNSPDFQYKADFGSGDFQYTSACAWHVVSIGIGIV